MSNHCCPTSHGSTHPLGKRPARGPQSERGGCEPHYKLYGLVAVSNDTQEALLMHLGIAFAGFTLDHASNLSFSMPHPYPKSISSDKNPSV
jgi:hypothetical protein